METQGRKEIAEAVLIAGLSALAAALVKWAVEEVQRRSRDGDEDEE